MNRYGTSTQRVVILEISDIYKGGDIDFLDQIYFSDGVFTFPNTNFKFNFLLSIDRMFIQW